MRHSLAACARLALALTPFAPLTGMAAASPAPAAEAPAQAQAGAKAEAKAGAKAGAVAAGAPETAAEGAPLEEIVVKGELRDTGVLNLPASVSVLDDETLRETTLQHFEEATSFIPNLNWSGEGSRARYFQLRGVGELEQYDGAPNPSVGFIIDDIDFSSLGTAATLFDVDRVEVLRGPQGTRYGANALGGLIYMRSTEPSDTLESNLELTRGTDGTEAAGAAVGGPAAEHADYRVSVQRYRSNGFRTNTYLHRDDTYGRDELTTRGKLRWNPSARVEVETTGLYVDVDNGYDAWTIDNDYTTESDRPGRDAQRSVAGSVRITADLDRFELVSISSANRTKAIYSFDADWGNPQLWSPYVYDYFSANDRIRRTDSQEVRLLSKPGAIANGRGDWLVGVYALGLAEANDLSNTGVYGDGRLPASTYDVLDDLSHSDYDARNLAVYGELDLALGSRAELTAGLRSERRAAHYADTNGNRFAPVDHMLGGELAVSWRLGEAWRPYVRLARGYKAGGFNTAFAGVDFGTVDNLTPDQIQFGPEFMWTLEAGLKGTWLGGRLSGDMDVFAGRRDAQQIKIPLQLRLGDPSSFLFLTENADKSRLSGLETTLQWRATHRLTVGGSLGLLSTDIASFPLYPGLDGRSEAHAPPWNFAVSAEYRTPEGWWGRFDVTGRDAFYFDYSHDQKSWSYSLVNLHGGRDFGDWSAELWVRNLLDRRYAVRGFYFGDEPPDFPNKLYVRLGDPRQAGVTLRYHF